ncbi:methyltransferase [Hahella sp. HN01]|uniref:methyltransferase n=1 Tax=Hahella sp. HN01 TaxID=2847262 RepID=UPI001C1E9216|nr:methyltransferase [Hahella sp. HN01]MBU6951340.1 methyltransferase domain-containing protein [Hahella sp. HN01]
MTFNPPHPMQAYWNIAATPVQGQSLKLAIEMDVFRLLQHPATASELARKTSTRPEKLGLLLEMLWSMGLLHRCGEAPVGDFEYSLTSVAREYFAPDVEDSLASAWRFRFDVLKTAADAMTRDRISADEMLENASHATDAGWAAAAQAQIAHEQASISAPALAELLTQIPALPNKGRLIDLGGGPGIMTQKLARAFPDMKAYLFEGPMTAAVARDSIGAAGMADRIDVLEGDLETDAFGDDYALIWCSSVLHFIHDRVAFLKRVKDALAPGGVFICAHGERSDDPGRNAELLPFYLPMLLRGCFVPRQGEVGELLVEAGFSVVQSAGRRHFALAPVQVMVARKEPRA